MNAFLLRVSIVIMAIFFMITGCVKSTAVGLFETDIPRAQVAVSQPKFKIVHNVDQVLVDATAEIVAPSKVTDFTATLTLYDCPTDITPIGNCDVLGTDSYEFDGSEAPIEADVPYGLDERFVVKNGLKPEGVYVAKLKLRDFQG